MLSRTLKQMSKGISNYAGYQVMNTRKKQEYRLPKNQTDQQEILRTFTEYHKKLMMTKKDQGIDLDLLWVDTNYSKVIIPQELIREYFQLRLVDLHKSKSITKAFLQNVLYYQINKLLPQDILNSIITGIQQNPYFHDYAISMLKDHNQKCKNTYLALKTFHLIKAFEDPTFKEKITTIMSDQISILLHSITSEQKDFKSNVVFLGNIIHVLVDTYKTNQSPHYHIFPPMRDLIQQMFDQLTDFMLNAQKANPKIIILLSQQYSGYVNFGAHSKNFQKMLKIIKLIQDRFTYQGTCILVNIFLKVGFKDDPIIDHFFDKMLRDLDSEVQQQTTINLLVALRSAINYNRHDFIRTALSNSRVRSRFIQPKIQLDEDGRIPMLDHIMLFNTYLCQQYGYQIPELEFSQLKRHIFEKHLSQVDNPFSTKSEDMAIYLEKLNIPYIREPCICPYNMDFYIPYLPEIGEEVHPKYKTKPFTDYEELESFIFSTVNPKSVFIEVNGKDHYYDEEQKYVNGGTLFKMKYFKDIFKWDIVVLTNIDISVWNDLKPEEKGEAIVKLIHKRKQEMSV